MSVAPAFRWEVPRLPVWALAVALYVIADVVLTGVGLSIGATEANPAAARALADFGLYIMIVAKAGVLALTYGAVRVTGWLGRPDLAFIHPLLLAVLGAAITVWNLVVVLTLF